MIYSSLAILALSATAAINPTGNLVHVRARVGEPDTRVNLVLVNKGQSFQDVSINGHIYTVMPSHTLSVKAPVGTIVYAASQTRMHHRGDAILEVDSTLNNKTVKLD